MKVVWQNLTVPSHCGTPSQALSGQGCPRGILNESSCDLVLHQDPVGCKQSQRL